MRVGVHTGTVLCGIVGKTRFKFDVWSNDVTLANIMESSGEPGKVHISESTKAFCDDQYDMEEGEEVPGQSPLFTSSFTPFSLSTADSPENCQLNVKKLPKT